MHWVYFALYTFVLAYATILTTSWTVYLAGHYDVQEAKRLLPFIQSGTLIGMVLGRLGVAFAPLIGAANVLWLWIGTLVAAVAMVRTITRVHTAIDTRARKTKRAAPGRACAKALPRALLTRALPLCS